MHSLLNKMEHKCSS